MSRPKKIEAPSPLLPPVYDEAVVLAIQALERGDASADQQKRALRWIVNDLCLTYDLPYGDTHRDSDIALGKLFVGQQIVKLIKLNLLAFRKTRKEGA